MNTSESATENTGTPAQSDSCKSRRSGCCSPHTSLLIAGIAIVIATYALVAGRDSGINSAVEERMTRIEEQIASMNTHLDQLGEDVKSNREQMIHTKLQKALENVQEIGQMASSETRSRLAEIETMLHDIIAPEEAAVPAELPAAAAPAADDIAAPAEAAADTATEPAAADATAEPAQPATDTTAPAATEPTPDSSEQPAATDQAL